MNKLSVIENKGQRVLTTQQLATAYEVDDKKIRDNFTNNKSRYVEGKHFFKIEGEDLKQFKNRTEIFGVVGSHSSSVYLWTELGTLHHAKSLGTDKAWEVFEMLEDTYFKEKRQVPQPLQIDSHFLFQIAAQLEEKEKQIAVLQPKAEYFDDLVDRNLLTSFRDTAKELRVQEGKLINWLLDNGYVYRDRKQQLSPYAQYVGKLFELKEWKNNVKAGNQTLITPRGRETFRLLLIKDGLIKEAC